MSSPHSNLPPNLDPRGRRPATGGRSTVRTAIGRIGLVLATVLSVTTLVGAGYLWREARGINSAGQRRNVAVGNDTTHGVNGSEQNILLVGNDDRTNLTAAEAHQLHVGKDGGSMATDTMMIVHIPANGDKATLISLPRDSYVAIPGFGMDKLNSAYVHGYFADTSSTATVESRQVAGIDLLLKSVTNLTGLTMSHYVQVSLLGFVRISDAIGGVPIDLCHNVDDTGAHNLAEGSSGGSGFKMTKGKHIIEGLTALQFVRQRHNFPNDAEDLDRVKRQQYFLTSAFRKVASVGVVTKLNAIKNALQDSIIADSGLKLFDLASQMSSLSANNITGKTIPTTNATLNDGTSILRVDPAKVKAYIAGVLAPKPAAPSTSPASTSPASTKGSAKASPATSSATPTAIDSKCIN